MKKRNYGLAITKPNEEVFKCGHFKCVEYCKSSLSTPDAFEIMESEVLQLIALSKKYGVEIRSFHLPFGKSEYFSFEPASLDEKLSTETLVLTKRLMEILVPTGIKYVILHGSQRIPPEERKKRLDIFVGYVRKLCDFCSDYGITVAIETLKPSCIGNGLAEHLYILENACRENLGICFDSNHLFNEDNIEFLKKAGQYVVTTHLSDFDGADERHWFPGRGINDWHSIVNVLNEKGYEGPYLFEVNFPELPAKTEDLDTLVEEWEKIFE